jgi:hypothetical protein
MQTSIKVKYTAEGVHRRIKAPRQIGYQKHMHSHLFHVTAIVHDNHGKNRVEHHELLQQCKQAFDGGDLGGKSCEMIAKHIVTALREEYDTHIMVEVSEDGLYSAIVSSEVVDE